jgi:CheY-like chemotaxis protein
LWIEDDPTQRLLISSVFSCSAGQDVVEAGRRRVGFKTDDMIPTSSCDVLMPGLTWYEFTEAWKKDPKLCFVPVIMLTALSEHVNVRVGMTAGYADDYLSNRFWY